jgi:putative thioredoxin
MPVSNVNPDRPVDLSRLTQQAAAPAAGGAVATVTTATFERDVVQRSLTGPVIVDVWSSRSPISIQLSALLDTMAAEYQGRLTFVRVAADTNPEIVQALQMEAIPSVFAFLGGRLVPLFTGGLPEAELRPLLDQVVAAAAQAGVQSGANPPEPPADPRFDGVTKALEEGDWDAAIAGYQSIL